MNSPSGASAPQWSMWTSLLQPAHHRWTERTDSTQKNTYFVSRWEVLQSLFRVPKFICIHLSCQSKTWSVNHSVTPLRKRGCTKNAGRPFTHLTMLRWSSRGGESCWFVWQARHRSPLCVLSDREFPCARVCRYSFVFHSFMPILNELTCSRWEKGSSEWRLRSQERRTRPLSFLNGLSEGKT